MKKHLLAVVLALLFALMACGIEPTPSNDDQPTPQSAPVLPEFPGIPATPERQSGMPNVPGAPLAPDVYTEYSNVLRNDIQNILIPGESEWKDLPDVEEFPEEALEILRKDSRLWNSIREHGMIPEGTPRPPLLEITQDLVSFRDDDSVFSYFGKIQKIFPDWGIIKRVAVCNLSGNFGIYGIVDASRPAAILAEIRDKNSNTSYQLMIIWPTSESNPP